MTFAPPVSRNIETKASYRLVEDPSLNKYLQSTAQPNGNSADDAEQSEALQATNSGRVVEAITAQGRSPDIEMTSHNDAGIEHDSNPEAVDRTNSQQDGTASIQIDDLVSGNLSDWGETSPSQVDAVDARYILPGVVDKTDMQQETRASAQAGTFISTSSLPLDWGETFPGPSVNSQNLFELPDSSIVSCDPSATMHSRIPDAVPEPRPQRTKTISDAAVFAQQVYIAASKILSRKSAHVLSLPSLPSSQSPSCLPECFVNEIASTAVEVIGSLAGLNTYIYGIVGCCYSSLTYRHPFQHPS